MKYVCSFGEDSHSLFQHDCTILLSRKSMNVLISLHSHDNLVLGFIINILAILINICYFFVLFLIFLLVKFVL